MRASMSKALPAHRLLLPVISLALATFTLAPGALAQSERKQIEGVKNFGQVTERFFRGGALTPVGIDKLAALGVRTIIDLRDKPSPGEPEACKQHGIRYYKFPMDGSGTPDDKAVNQILSIIQDAQAPVYVHCSAGKHRAGTIAALYRTRVQGWPKEKAWAEQQSYGFGPAEEHPSLYAYVYGSNSNKHDERALPADLVSESKSKSSKSKKDDDEKGKAAKKDDDDDKKDKASKKADKLAKSKKHDDDDDDDNKVKEKSDKKSKKKDKARAENSEVAVPAEDKAKAEPIPEVKPTAAAKGLSVDARYIKLAAAIKRAQAEGGSGEVLKVDLEWDEARATVTWDVTFSSGNEYEVDAISGEFLGAKAKSVAKLATLAPLNLHDRDLLTFQKILRKAEKERAQGVMEMELKHIKGNAETVFEATLSDGTTILYDAATGKALTEL